LDEEPAGQPVQVLEPVKLANVPSGQEVQLFVSVVEKNPAAQPVHRDVPEFNEYCPAGQFEQAEG